MAKSTIGVSAQQLLSRASELHQAGKLKRAEKEYREYLALRPDDPDALMRFGVLRAQQKEFASAASLFKRSIDIAPDSPPAHYNLGRAQLELGSFEDAVASLEAALELAPGRVETHNNLANALREIGRYDDAVAHYEKALQINPRQSEVAYNLGLVCRHLYRMDEAVKYLALAARLDPEDPTIHFNLAEMLYRTSQPLLAVKAYSKVVELAPDHASALSRLALCKRQSAEWSDLDAVEKSVVERVRRRPGADGTFVSPFALAAMSDDPALILECARGTASSIAARAKAARLRRVKYTHDCIRVAYVAGDYREHATSYLIADLIEIHDRSRFEVYGISFGPEEDSPMRRRMSQAFDTFIDVRQLSPMETTRVMRQHEIDIAVDLVGFNQFQRMEIFALRPAPIQVNYLGWPGTTGARFMDYIMADPIVIPDESRQYFEEAVVQLPECYQSNDRKRAAASRAPTRAECGLPDRGVVFCCFNNIYKISPQVFEDWLAITKSVDGSVLWLLDDSPEASKALRAEMSRRGMSPDRLVLSPRLPLAEHLARHCHADIFLDTFPYNAHTTTSDALFMGVPVVTRVGRSFQSRVAASLLTAAGVPELVTESNEAFRDLAIALATDAGRREQYKLQLVQNRESMILFDTDRLRQHIEHAYMTMNARLQRGEAPVSFRVEPVTSPHAA